MKYFFSFFTIILLMSACTSTPNTASGEPAWIYNPNKDGKVGGVGMCMEHFKGIQMQRIVAIQRAQSELASQLGVNVKDMVVCDQNSRGKGGCEAHTQVSTDNKVQAQIEEIYKDRRTGALYVWMVQY